MRLLILIACLLTIVEASAQRRIGKHYQLEQVSFEDMIHRYLHRDGLPASKVEGIYSVSCIITTSRRHWLTGKEVVRTVERKDNYARVAIMKENMSLNRDFMEVSMSNKDATKYTIVGDLSEMADGSGYVYKHIEPDGKVLTFSMLLTQPDLLEGQFAETRRKKLVTTRLSYFKIYPKVEKDAVVSTR